MARHIAFLRAINVGGHTVKMDHLRLLFEQMGFAKVETFIASGNVIFETSSADSKALEGRIEAALKDGLGYEVATFLRSEEELAEIARYQAFPRARVEAAGALNVAFVADPVSEAAAQKLMALRTGIDDFAVHGREIYWLCQVKQSESKFSNAALEKALGVSSTLRGISTIHKMAAKYSPR